MRIPGLCLLLILCVAAHAGDLDEVRSLAAAGAHTLALDLLDTEQAPPERDLKGWMRWERERARLLAAEGAWERLAERLAGVPEGVPPAFARWAGSRRAEALLELGEGAEARRVLRGLLWAPKSAPEAIRQWRRLVIRSYLVEGRPRDAYTALLRYRHDYGAGEGAEAVLNGQVLLAQGRAGDAARYLAEVEGNQATIFRLLARLRAGEVPAWRVARDLRALLRNRDLQPAERQLLWAAIAEAAGAAEDWGSQVTALEELLAFDAPLALQAGIFSHTPDTLWQAYLDYAGSVGNRQQLLLGDDAAWLAEAEAAAKRFPARSRAIYALLALQGATGEGRSAGHRGLTRALTSRSWGMAVLRQLYLQAERFAGIEAVPPAVRQTLVDPAIAGGEIQLASRLLEGLAEPPSGTDRVMWQLRRARVFIMAGAHAQGIVVLDTLAESAGELPRRQVDRLVQVLFDLQTVEQHEAAYALFETLFAQVEEAALRRELLYWMADSRRAQSRHREAARLYLRSAGLHRADAMDPWAQTARYQAAKSLAEAGLVEDARRIYRQLLGVTEDTARRAVLERELQQLWLQVRE